MSDDPFGTTPAQDERIARARRRAATAQAIQQATDEGDLDRAARLLDTYARSIGVPVARAAADVADAMPATPEHERRPAPKAPTARAVKKAATAARKAAERQAAKGASETAARKARATIALVVSTLAKLRQDPAQANRWPDAPFAGLRGRNVKPAGLAGGFLRARFLDDERLTPDEAAVTIMALIAGKRGPVLLTHQAWDRALGAGRNGPHRTAELGGRPWQLLYDAEPVTGRGWVDVPLGLTRFDPTDDDTTDLIDSDTDVDEVPTWIAEDPDE